MERRSVESLVRVLNDAGVRYLIVGGLAVVAHGHARFTGDVDLALDLDPGNARRAVEAFESLGYRPRAPVRFGDFADPARRADWISSKGLTVFSASSPEHPATEVDLFVENPFEFEDVYARAAHFEIGPGVEAPFIPLKDLIAMKRKAGRPIDLDDARVLEDLERGRERA
jgi:predicted nucleotidyltransferase